jgi:streptogramin lyase
MSAAVKAVVATLALGAQIQSAEAEGFERLATFKGIGGVGGFTVAPGPAKDSEWYYASFTYVGVGKSFEIVGVDPDTGTSRVFRSPVQTEQGARAVIAGPDGRVYIGTQPHAHLMRLDPQKGVLEDLGQPAANAQYLWALCVGADGRIYGGTYPSAQLIRYDLRSNKSEDLGRMDPVQEYARYIAASDDGFVYIGIGSIKANVVAYEIATGKHAEILPTAYQSTGFAGVLRGKDGRVYGYVGSQYFKFSGWTVTPVDRKDTEGSSPVNRLRDGRVVSLQSGSFAIMEPKTRAVSQIPVSYRGKELSLFRLGAGPDGAIYGSTAIPLHLMRLDPGPLVLSELAELGTGEVYSFLSKPPYLLMAAYSELAPLMRLDLRKPISIPADRGDNPELVTFPGMDGSWRPQAMIAGPDGNVYIGAVAGYGKLSGDLVAWDVPAEKIVSYHDVVPQQGIASLVVWNGQLVGGTTIAGGGGSHSAAAQAVLFLWDTHQKRKTFEIAPVPGAAAITDLTLTSDGIIWGIAAQSVFAFDPVHLRVVNTSPLPFTPIYNSVAIDSEGRIWGLAEQGVFVIDQKTKKAALANKSPCTITTGFAAVGNVFYFACQADLWRYHLPSGRQTGEFSPAEPYGRR